MVERLSILAEKYLSVQYPELVVADIVGQPLCLYNHFFWSYMHRKLRCYEIVTILLIVEMPNVMYNH